MTSGRCEGHRRQAQRHCDENRGTPRERGYDRAWERLRTLKLAANPFCEIRKHCADLTRARQLARDVDHIVPIAERPELRLVWSNLQSACQACHRWKTATQDGGFGRPIARPVG